MAPSKKFVYQMQKILDMRARKEEQLKAELANSIRTRDLEVAALNTLVEKRGKAQKSLEGYLARGEVAEVQNTNLFLNNLAGKIDNQNRVVTKSNQKVEEVRKKLTVAAKEKKIIEKHKNIQPGTKYFYRLDCQNDYPDPASHYQPEGVHGPSEVINHRSFKWEDSEWKGINIDQMIIYELHVGTFSDKGIFKSIIPKLDELKDLGINTIEILPLAQFSGNRNWGYDGVYHFAVQNSYGRPEDFKKLVNECHKKGISVILDVVYNHFGPEGNYTGNFAPYLTEKHKSPWGQSVNFDDQYSDDVRNFFIQNISYWINEYHIDAFRLDAIHTIFDNGAKHFLKELAEFTEELGKINERKYYLFAESDLNDTRVTRSGELGGYGIDAQWSDDFCHALRSLFTDEMHAYYIDFGKTEDLVKAYKEGFVISGKYSRHRKRTHGESSKNIPANNLIIFSQNHDQVGNRLHGERLFNTDSLKQHLLAAASLILSPYIPMLFMGEEYAEDNPFLYFVNHEDKHLNEAVKNGRKEEFKSFFWNAEPFDPSAEETFLKSKLNWENRNKDKHKISLDFYKKLIEMRKEIHYYIIV